MRDGRSRVKAGLLAVLVVAMGAGGVWGQESCPAASTLVGGLRQPRAAVRYLADESLEGRLAGSRGERCAAEYLAGEFERLGLRPAGDSGSYFQALPLATVMNPHAPTSRGRNVVAILPGRSGWEVVVVVGAHYDHLGRGGFGSLAPDDVGVVHPGADDNASGTAALLRVAERLARGRRLGAAVIFVAFTGEEEGLLGSRYYAAHPVVPLAKTRAMLNMDMVGRLGAAKLLVYGTGTAKEWPALLAAANRGADSLRLSEMGDGLGASDQTSFYERDVPVLHFFTNVHGDYHKPSDTWDKLDYAGIGRVAELVAGLTGEVADREAALTLQRGVGGAVKADSAARRPWRVYLGTIPDFTPVEKGVKISGVRAGSPADKAGLKAGDIIVAFDRTEIGDLYAMTDALRARSPGDTVRITVLRNGRPVALTAVLERR